MTPKRTEQSNRWDMNKFTESPTLEALLGSMTIMGETPQVFPHESMDLTNRAPISYQQSVQMQEVLLSSLYDKGLDTKLDLRFTGPELLRHFNTLYESINLPMQVSPSYYHMPIVSISTVFDHLAFHHKRASPEAIKTATVHLDQLEKILPPANPGYISAVNALASLYLTQQTEEDNSKAELLHRKILMTQQKALGPGHPRTVLAYLNLILSMLKGKDNFVKVKDFHEKIHPQIVKKFGFDHELSMRSTAFVAELCNDVGRTGDSEMMFRQLFQISLSKFGLRHVFTTSIMCALVNVLTPDVWTHQFDLEKATLISFTSNSIEIQEKYLQTIDPTFGYRTLAAIHMQSKRLDESIRLLKKVVRLGCKDTSTFSRKNGENLFWLSFTVYKNQQYHRAEALFRAYFSWNIEFDWGRYWRPFRTRNYAMILFRLGYLEEATMRWEEFYGFFSKKETQNEYASMKGRITDYLSMSSGELKNLYALQGLHLDETSLESRLNYVAKHKDFDTFLMDRERKWCRFEDDEYKADIVYRLTKKRRKDD
jgi:hypothetical protein